MQFGSTGRVCLLFAGGGFRFGLCFQIAGVVVLLISSTGSQSHQSTAPWHPSAFQSTPPNILYPSTAPVPFKWSNQMTPGDPCSPFSMF